MPADNTTHLDLFYATNRKHRGKKRFEPKGYGGEFSSSGTENLRFGKLALPVSMAKVAAYLAKSADGDSGDGEGLSGYLAKCAGKAVIHAYHEKLSPEASEARQSATLGSIGFFEDLRTAMLKNCDVVTYIHGFNVDWKQAVGAASALQLMLNRESARNGARPTLVMLFSWPSDGSMMPFVAYKSDRAEAAASGKAVGRGLLKLRDYLRGLNPQDRCDQSMHLLCHSMGNYVLQNALARLIEFAEGRALSRLFDQVLLCSPDVDEDALEPGQPLGRLHELCRSISVYYNRGDTAMYISDYTKGNPDRLGNEGPARPGQVHHKVQSIDCSPIVSGLVEHSYYLWGAVNTDIRLSIDGMSRDNPARRRKAKPGRAASWEMTGR